MEPKLTNLFGGRQQGNRVTEGTVTTPPTGDDGVPGQHHVGQVGAERQTGCSLRLPPEVERLRETAHRPDRVTHALVQLCNESGRVGLSRPHTMSLGSDIPRRSSDFL